MSITVAQLKSKLDTHAATAGITLFVFGYLEDVNKGASDRDMDNKYPLMLFVPDDWEITDLSKQTIPIKFYVFKYFADGSVRETLWDNCITIVKAFKVAINSDVSLQIKDRDIISKLIPEGAIGIDNSPCVMCDCNLEINC
jgi:hypothetical protein